MPLPPTFLYSGNHQFVSVSLLLLCYFCSFIFFSSTYKWNHALHWHLVGDPTLVSKVKIELSSPFKEGSFPVSEDRSSQQPCYQMHKPSWNHPRPVSSKLTGKLITIKFNLGTSCGYFAGWNQFKLSRTENDLIFFHTYKQISLTQFCERWQRQEVPGSETNGFISHDTASCMSFKLASAPPVPYSHGSPVNAVDSKQTCTLLCEEQYFYLQRLCILTHIAQNTNWKCLCSQDMQNYDTCGPFCLNVFSF